MGVLDDDGMLKVFVEVIDIFGHAIFQASPDADVVDHDEVTDIFAQADAAGVRANWDPKPFGQQHHGQTLVHPAQATTIDLTKPDRAKLHDVLRNLIANAHTYAPEHSEIVVEAARANGIVSLSEVRGYLRAGAPA